MRTSVWTSFSLSLAVGFTSLGGTLAAGAELLATLNGQNVSQDWGRYAPLALSAVSKTIDEREAAGQTLIQFSILPATDPQSEPRLSLIFAPKTSVYGKTSFERDLAAVTLEAFVEGRAAQGKFLIDLAPYTTAAGARVYAALFAQYHVAEQPLSYGYVAWKSRAEFDAAQKEQQALGRELHSLTVRIQDGTPRYTAVWLRKSPKTDSYLEADVALGQVKNRIEAQRTLGFEVGRVFVVPQVGQDSVAFLRFSKRGDGRQNRFLRAAPLSVYTDYREHLTDQGYRAIQLQLSRSTAGELQVSGVFVPNQTERLEWPQKNEINKIVTAFASPGPSASPVAGGALGIAVGGRIVYLRGFGSMGPRDDTEGAPAREAHGRTVFRLASVSKAVTGTLAYVLAQNRNLPLNASLKSHPAFSGSPLAAQVNFPAQCTVQGALDCSCGVPNYLTPLKPATGNFSGVSSQAVKTEPFDAATHTSTFALTTLLSQFPSAATASPRNVYLPAFTQVPVSPAPTPAPVPYHEYSTFSYTPLERTLELFSKTFSDGGKEIPYCELLEQEVSKPLGIGLKCLHAEQKAREPLVSRFFNKGTAELIPLKAEESVWWRIAGGGYSASVQDMLVFGSAILANENFLSTASRGSMLCGNGSVPSDLTSCSPLPKCNGKRVDPTDNKEKSFSSCLPSTDSQGKYFTTSYRSGWKKRAASTSKGIPAYFWKDGDAPGVNSELNLFPAALGGQDVVIFGVTPQEATALEDRLEEVRAVLFPAPSPSPSASP